MDYEKVIRYFTAGQKSPTPWVIMLLAALVCAFIGFTQVLTLVPFALAFGIFPLCKLISYAKKRVKDSYIDGIIAEKIKNVTQQALYKLGVDQEEVNEIAPISFSGFVWEGEGVVAKMGKDGNYRSNKYEVALLFFSQNEVYSYTYNFYITKANEVEKTTLYFYQDILTVSTCTKEITLRGGSVIHYDSFELVTAGKTLSCQFKNNETAQRSIKGLRSMIKSKKLSN